MEKRGELLGKMCDRLALKRIRQVKNDKIEKAVIYFAHFSNFCLKFLRKKYPEISFKRKNKGRAVKIEKK